MIYELRTYEAVTGRMPALHKRFAETTLALFAKHGIKVVGFWTSDIGGASNELVYMLAYESLADREQRWSAFAADPEWQQKPGKHTIAIIAHGVTLRTIFHYITGFDTKFIRRTEVHNCSISRFRFGPSGWSIVSINDASHTLELGDIVRERMAQADNVVP